MSKSKAVGVGVGIGVAPLSRSPSAIVVRRLLVLVASGLLFSTEAFAPGLNVRSTLLSSSRNPARDVFRRRGRVGPLSVEPLKTEGDWSAFLDVENTGMVYYFNTKTGESLWEPPTDTFPKVVVSSEPENTEGGEEKKKEGLFGGMFSFLSKDDDVDDATDAKDDEDSAKTISADDSIKPDFFADIVSKLQMPDGAAATTTNPDAAANESPVVSGDGATDKTASSSSSSRIELPDLNSFFQQKAKSARATPAPAPAPVAKTDTAVPSVAPLTLECATRVVPHPEKVSWGGEDAVFVRGRSFGVFDGVSGADKLDGLPLYSRTLADRMSVAVASSSASDEGLTLRRLTELLTEAAEYADERATGASTALVASLGSDNYLRVLNVGDCGVAVVRDGAVAHRTRDVVHYFDCPYQLSVDSPDRPKDGTRLNAELAAGDYVVAASDGVFDNLSEAEIVDALSSTGTVATARAAARSLLDRARQNSLDPEAETPYAKSARRNGVKEYKSGRGGKVDDISCVVVRVK